MFTADGIEGIEVLRTKIPTELHHGVNSVVI